MTEKSEYHKYSFVQKVWIVGSIFALIAVILLLFKATFNVFILILAGSLIAIFFRGLSSLIRKKTNWKSGLTLTISIIGTFLIIAAIFWLIGAKVQSQISQLSDTLPATVQNAKDYLNNSTIGQEITTKFSEARSQGKITKFFTSFFKTTFGVIGDIYIILLIGVFFTVSPWLYTSGIKQLVPPGKRGKADDVLNKLGNNLKKWVAGKLFSMLVVFILTAIGLVIIGVPMWLALALIAGMLNFVPNFGPLIAMIPAVLVSLSVSPTTALIVAGLYIVVQMMESNFITPKVQQHLVKIPPALIIISQVLVATFTGLWGIIFATPLILIIMILVQELYVKPMNKKAEVET
ncbi:MAG TPA: AI-2E family transporter [Salinimicrobium sp.]|nr:AI-2E family transporter [Salinimicrobium sp.]